MIPLRLKGYPKQAKIHRRIQHVGFLPDAKLHVAGKSNRVFRIGLICGPGRDKRDLFSFGIKHQYAGPFQAAGRQIKIPFGIDAHPVATGLLAEVVQNLFGSTDKSVRVERICNYRHRAKLGGWRSGINFVASIVVIRDIERLFVGAERDSVRFGNVMGDFNDFSVSVDAIDGPVFQLSFLISQISRVGEIDASLTIEA